MFTLFLSLLSTVLDCAELLPLLQPFDAISLGTTDLLLMHLLTQHRSLDEIKHFDLVLGARTRVEGQSG